MTWLSGVRADGPSPSPTDPGAIPAPTGTPTTPFTVDVTPKGWQAGTPLKGTPDPSSSPNPTDMFGSFWHSLQLLFTSAAGAVLLFVVGIMAVVKGWAWYVAMFKKPRQLTLF